MWEHKSKINSQAELGSLWKRGFAASTVFLLITLGICVLCGCSRPTAVNLADAATTLLALVQEAADEGADAESAYQVSTWLQINSNNSAFDWEEIVVLTCA